MLQIRFPQTVCVSGIKIGGVPNAGTEADAPFIRVFAKSASLLSSARFSCLLEHEHLPELQSTKAVRFEVRNTTVLVWLWETLLNSISRGSKSATLVQVTPTDTMIVRGRFQTLPLAIYGWTLPPAPGQVACLLKSFYAIHAALAISNVLEKHALVVPFKAPQAHIETSEPRQDLTCGYAGVHQCLFTCASLQLPRSSQRMVRSQSPICRLISGYH